jgi:hypothetical protein
LNRRQASGPYSLDLGTSLTKLGRQLDRHDSHLNQWYRAKVRKASAIKKEAVLYFIDYGNEETLPFSRIRQVQHGLLFDGASLSHLGTVPLIVLAEFGGYEVSCLSKRRPCCTLSTMETKRRCHSRGSDHSMPNSSPWLRGLLSLARSRREHWQFAVDGAGQSRS